MSSQGIIKRRTSRSAQELLPQGQVHRPRGTGRIWKIGRIWWLQYYSNGQQVRESSHSDRKFAAEHLLHRRLGEAAAGTLLPRRTVRLTYFELREALIADYKTNQRRWLRKSKDGRPYVGGISHLNKFFTGYRALNINTDNIRRYINLRQSEGAANGTINRELALLRRMFRLAVQDRKLRDVPYFPMLKESPPRKGFLEHWQYIRLRQELPEYLRPIVAMGFYTGMRLGEILGLRWENVDLLNAQVHLDPETTKNDEPRTVPLVYELLELLKIERQKNPEAQWVFTRGRRPVGSFYKAWTSACERAGLCGLLFHDLRRTGVRNMVRAGVPERVAMAVSGHKTRAVFERYNIVSERDLQDAARKLNTYLVEQTLIRQNGASSGQIVLEELNESAAARDGIH
jgi:integrase